MSSYNTKNDGIHGFYYDEELKNPFLSVTLHPNMILHRNSEGKIYVTDEGLPEWIRVGSSGSIKSSGKPKISGKKKKSSKTDEGTSDEGKDNDSFSYTKASAGNLTEDIRDDRKLQYAVTPIARAIVSEDFQVAISNTWSDFGGDPLGNLWNQNKPMAAYADAFSDVFESISKSAKDAEDSSKNSVEKGFASVVNKVASAMKKGQDAQAKYLNRSLVAQGTRFTYYGGTGVGFGNLGLKYTIFPEYLVDKKNGKIVFSSVNDQLRELFPYVIGDYMGISPNLFKVGQNLFEGTSFNRALKTLEDDFGEFVHQWFSWQLPPGGFKPNLHYIDTVQEGTLKLKIGPYYALENLTVENCQLNFSKEMVKDPIHPSKLSPLYCEVNLSLKPATKWTKNALMAFVEGRARSDISGFSGNGTGTLETAMASSLKSVKKLMNKNKKQALGNDSLSGLKNRLLNSDQYDGELQDMLDSSEVSSMITDTDATPMTKVAGMADNNIANPGKIQRRKAPPKSSSSRKKTARVTTRRRTTGRGKGKKR